MYKLMFAFIIILAIALASCSGNADGSSETSEKVENVKAKELEWMNFNEGLSTAQKENKPVLIDFYTDWCHWCKVMDEKTFQEAAVSQKLSERYITIRIDAEDRNSNVQYKGQTLSNVEFTRAFRVTGFPSIGFLDAKGEAITVIPGFIPPETFIHILDYIDKECYKKQISFEDYLKRKEDCK